MVVHILIYWFSSLDKKEKSKIKWEKWRWCFQYAETAAFNFDKIKTGTGIKYSSKIDNWIKFEN